MTNPRTVIFLDIDGVLQPTWKQDRFKHDMDELRRTLAARYANDEYLTMDRYDLAAVTYDWEPSAVARLRSLCDDFGAEIVISSAWREFNPLPRLKDYFRLHDLDGYITGETPQRYTSEKSRAGEVEMYLDEHPEIERFVIFDDSYLSSFETLYPAEFVYCYGYLKEEEYAKARAILGNPPAQTVDPANPNQIVENPPPVSLALSAKGIRHAIFRHAGPVASLEQAAAERGQQPAQVVRSILFRLGRDKAGDGPGDFAIVLVAGPGQIDWKRLRQFFNQSRLTMATPDEVLAVTGYRVGAVAPFGMNTQIPVIVDRSIEEQRIISLGSGERGTAIILSTAVLLKALGEEVTVGDFAQRED